ncbi:MAG: CDP-glycerol glycerophosphotransferase family protein [Thermodesulfobacteriota bacterium]|nr:CDP-glycerol glycerophosphotransferase family protein [Thermodesulfobacteriota bacterium]
MGNVVYFSKMFQAVPHLAQIHTVLPGMFVSNRRSTLKATAKLYPDMPQARYSRLLSSLASGNRRLTGAEVIVTGSPYKSFLQHYSAKKCTVFHGTYMMLSKQALLSNAHYDLLCVIGPRMQQMIDRFASTTTLKTVVNTGFLPFCEFPQQSEELRQSALLSMGLDPTKKTILYAPSRRGVGSWDQVAENLIKTTPLDYNLILRPHPNQALTSRSADRTSFRRVQTIAKHHPHSLLDLTSKPLSLLLSITDLIISDANSPAEESMFYDVPQLFIETPGYSRDMMRQQATREEMHPDDTEQLLSLYDCGPCYHTKNSIDFSSVLNRAILDAPNYAPQRQRYFSWVFGSRDRKANERVAQAISTYLL